MNALKHGNRSRKLALLREESRAFEDRLRRWMAIGDAQNDVEEYLKQWKQILFKLRQIPVLFRDLTTGRPSQGTPPRRKRENPADRHPKAAIPNLRRRIRANGLAGEACRQRFRSPSRGDYDPKRSGGRWRGWWKRS